MKAIFFWSANYAVHGESQWGGWRMRKGPSKNTENRLQKMVKESKARCWYPELETDLLSKNLPPVLVRGKRNCWVCSPRMISTLGSVSHFSRTAETWKSVSTVYFTLRFLTLWEKSWNLPQSSQYSENTVHTQTQRLLDFNFKVVFLGNTTTTT